jgi:hypothetical protein
VKNFDHLECSLVYQEDNGIIENLDFIIRGTAEDAAVVNNQKEHVQKSTELHWRGYFYMVPWTLLEERKEWKGRTTFSQLLGPETGELQT